MQHQEHPINRSGSADAKIDLYRQMMRIRRFEQAAIKQFCAGKMDGWLILSIGQESVAGVRSLMGPDDHSISGPRGMGHALAAGVEMGPMMAEYFGRTTESSKTGHHFFGDRV